MKASYRITLRLTRVKGTQSWKMEKRFSVFLEWRWDRKLRFAWRTENILGEENALRIMNRGNALDIISWHEFEFHNGIRIICLYHFAFNLPIKTLHESRPFLFLPGEDVHRAYCRRYPFVTGSWWSHTSMWRQQGRLALAMALWHCDCDLLDWCVFCRSCRKANGAVLPYSRTCLL